MASPVSSPSRGRHVQDSDGTQAARRAWCEAGAALGLVVSGGDGRPIPDMEGWTQGLFTQIGSIDGALHGGCRTRIAVHGHGDLIGHVTCRSPGTGHVSPAARACITGDAAFDAAVRAGGRQEHVSALLGVGERVLVQRHVQRTRFVGDEPVIHAYIHDGALVVELQGGGPPPPWLVPCVREMATTAERLAFEGPPRVRLVQHAAQDDEPGVRAHCLLVLASGDAHVTRDVNALRRASRLALRDPDARVGLVGALCLRAEGEPIAEEPPTDESGSPRLRLQALPADAAPLQGDMGILSDWLERCPAEALLPVATRLTWRDPAAAAALWTHAQRSRDERVRRRAAAALGIGDSGAATGAHGGAKPD